MRFTSIFLIILLSLFAVPEMLSAKAKPYHVFEYDVPVAHYHQDGQIIPNRLMEVGAVYGDMTINKCTAHKTYMSGIRFIFRNHKVNASDREMFAITCDHKTGSLFASYVRRKLMLSGDYEDIADEKKMLVGIVGQTVLMSLQLYSDTVHFTLGNQSFSQKLNFEVKDIELIGVGSSGVARFFEQELVS